MIYLTPEQAKLIAYALATVYQHNNWEICKEARKLLNDEIKKSKRKWLALTREEINDIQFQAYGRQYKLCRFIEAALKEKNCV